MHHLVYQMNRVHIPPLNRMAGPSFCCQVLYMIFCVVWFHVYVNLPFNNSVSFLTEQQNVDDTALQKVESCETRTLLVLFCDQSSCSKSHNRTGIRISVTCLFCILFTFSHFMLYSSYIFQPLCVVATKKVTFFAPAYTIIKVAHPMPLVHTYKTPYWSFFTYKLLLNFQSKVQPTILLLTRQQLLGISLGYVALHLLQWVAVSV